MTDITAEMADRYSESVAAILGDDTIVFHVLPITASLETVIRNKGPNPNFDADAEALCGQAVNDMDCMVILGSDILTKLRTREQMAEVAIDHIERHINAVWPPAETPVEAEQAWQRGWALDLAAFLTTADLSTDDNDDR